MSQMPEIDRLLAADEHNISEMRKVFAGYQGLPELLNEAHVLYTTCSRAFWYTLGHESDSLPQDTSPDSPAVAALVAKQFRALLFAHIGVFYGMAITDLLRMRLRAPLGYVRLQCESIALLKLMSEDSAITHEWAKIQTDKQGQVFYNKYQGRIKNTLTPYHLSDVYGQTSASALHIRPIGLARAYKSGTYEDGLHVMHYEKMLAQEFNSDQPHSFMKAVIFRVLRAQALIFASLPSATPEINDPLLLETRFPQFISRVNHLMDRAREHFAHYHRNNVE